MEGKVKWFNRIKGYGFIQGADGQDYFVHHKAIPQGVFLNENDEVSFEAAETDKGLQAQNVQMVKKAPRVQGGDRRQERRAPQEEQESSEDEEYEEAA